MLKFNIIIFSVFMFELIAFFLLWELLLYLIALKGIYKINQIKSNTVTKRDTKKTIQSNEPFLDIQKKITNPKKK